MYFHIEINNVITYLQTQLALRARCVNQALDPSKELVGKDSSTVRSRLATVRLQNTKCFKDYAKREV